MGLLCCRLKIERKWQGEDLFDRLREERGLSAGMLEKSCWEAACLGFSQGKGKDLVG
jgi:hypothetical protein